MTELSDHLLQNILQTESWCFYNEIYKTVQNVYNKAFPLEVEIFRSAFSPQQFIT